jgi:hypothetical protein
VSSIRPLSSSARARLNAFFEAPLPPQPLGFLRIAVAGFALVQAALWYPDWQVFFGPDGWLQWEVSRALTLDWSLHLSRIHAALAPLGLSEEQTVTGFFYFYVAAATGLLVGWHTRIFAFCTWVAHFAMMTTIPTFMYGVDIFLHIGLFYLLVMPVAKAYSVDVLQGRVSPDPTWGVTLSLRVLQIHVCLVYLSSGYEKARSVDWWSGNALWRSLVQPDFRQFDFTWLAEWSWLVVALSWFTIVVEAGYCVGMWIPRLRIFWLAAIVALHLGIGICLGLPLFGLIMILLSLAAFGHLALEDARAWRRSPLPAGRLVEAADAT